AIGLQIFRNPKKKEVRNWYRDNFGSAAGFRSIDVEGYNGITNGSDYYISALNSVSSTNVQSGSVEYTLYHNIYHFSVNQGARSKSKKILTGDDGIIQNISFNTNLKGSGKCLANSNNNPTNMDSKWSVRYEKNLKHTVDILCDTDFQCRDQYGLGKTEKREEILSSVNAILNTDEFSQLIALKQKAIKQKRNKKKQASEKKKKKKIQSNINSLTRKLNNIKAHAKVVTSTANLIQQKMNERFKNYKNKRDEIQKSLPKKTKVGNLSINVGIKKQVDEVFKKMRDDDDYLADLPQESEVKKELKELEEMGSNDLDWSNGYCANVTDKLKRDWQRLKDVRQMQKALRDGAIPMDSGSYIPSYTNSKWPSWQTLSRRADSPGFPVDPINKMVGCSKGKGDLDDVDPATCWNPVSSTYHYPNFSKMYEYQFNSSTKDYTLYVDFEFLKPK
ncbi:MAG: hypothetical protein ABEJ24_04510, partial [Candidatus Magasanikbacteria bacterium]